MVEVPPGEPAPPGYPPELAALTATGPDAYLTVHYGPDPDQFGELWPAARDGDWSGSRRGARRAEPDRSNHPAPVVVLVHGGYWRDRYRLDLMHAMAADLASRGFAVWNVEYRRVGSPGGGWPGTFLDVAAAFDALADLAGQHRLDLTRIAAVGHSAGGHLALWACGRHRLADGTLGASAALGSTALGGTALGGTAHGGTAHGGTALDADARSTSRAPFATPPRVTPVLAVSLAGVGDLCLAAELGLSDGAVRGLLGGGPEEIPAVYDVACPVQLLPLGVPQVVLHGTGDLDVPLEVSTRYAQRAGAECDLVVLPGADHIALIDPESAAWPSVLNALTRL
jgi:acetyl esterase/lipase